MATINVVIATQGEERRRFKSDRTTKVNSHHRILPVELSDGSTTYLNLTLVRRGPGWASWRLTYDLKITEAVDKPTYILLPGNWSQREINAYVRRLAYRWVVRQGVAVDTAGGSNRIENIVKLYPPN